MNPKRRFWAELLMSILLLSVLGGAGGCAKASPAAYTQEDVTAVAISCGNMDRSYSYSFWAHREENGWKFHATCFLMQNEVEAELADCPMTEEEVDALFQILEQNDSIASLSRDMRKRWKNHAVDETIYSFCITFSDGNQGNSSKRQSDLEKFFYDLAEKYEDATSK